MTDGQEQQEKSTTSDNLILWESVEETNPGFVKPVTIGTFTYSAICHTYQAKRATEKFGLYGQGWGLSVSTFNYSLLEATGLVIHDATFFYTLNGDKIEFVMHNSIEAKKYYQGSHQGRFDDEFAKKLETNTLSKALSRLGFSADVFMGKFDDAEYVSEMKIKAGLEEVEQSDDVKKEKTAEFYAQMEKDLKSYALVPNVSGIKAVYGNHMSNAKQVCQILGLDWKAVGKKFQDAQRAAIYKIEHPEAVDESEKDSDTE